jgi:GNAT superfamily N-acetyltransferase
MVGATDIVLLLARHEGVPVGGALGVRVDATVGVFGVGVVAASRRRGLGGALTCAAARAVGMPDDVAWLFPSEQARPLYERLGFVAADAWEVWVGPAA